MGSNKDYMRVYSRKWRKENPDKVKAIRERERISQNRIRKIRRDTDPSYRLLTVTRNRINRALSGARKSKRTIDLLGCTVEHARKHLESRFLPGMTWENFGYWGWHIDHIKPCASFDMSDPNQQAQCFHYSNLQPLWATDNIAKRDNILNKKDGDILLSPPLITNGSMT